MVANLKGVCPSQDSVSDWKDAVAVVVPAAASRHLFWHSPALYRTYPAVLSAHIHPFQYPMTP